MRGRGRGWRQGSCPPIQHATCSLGSPAKRHCNLGSKGQGQMAAAAARCHTVVVELGTGTQIFFFPGAHPGSWWPGPGPVLSKKQASIIKVSLDGSSAFEAGGTKSHLKIYSVLLHVLQTQGPTNPAWISEGGKFSHSFPDG